MRQENWRQPIVRDYNQEVDSRNNGDREQQKRGSRQGYRRCSQQRDSDCQITCGDRSEEDAVGGAKCRRGKQKRSNGPID